MGRGYKFVPREYPLSLDVVVSISGDLTLSLTMITPSPSSESTVFKTLAKGAPYESRACIAELFSSCMTVIPAHVS